MEVRNAANPKDVKNYDTTRLREDFLIQGLFVPGEIKLVYSQVDRMITGSVCPVEPITLEAGKELRSDYFLERREMGIINIGSKGSVTVDGTVYELDTKDGLYIGMGSKNVVFSSEDPENPAKFYFNSAPAHKTYPTEKIEISKAEPAKMGSQLESNQRTIYKYIHPLGVKSCQLVMGMTILEPGSVWNSMPCHTMTAEWRSIVLNMPEDAVMFHFMGNQRDKAYCYEK